MNFKTILSVFAILSLIGGLGCMLVPSALVGSFGVTLSPMGLVIYQFWGVSLAGIGALAWVLRGLEDNRMQLAVAAVLAIVNALNAVMAVRGQFNGANVSGWSNVVLFALFALVFAALTLRLRANATA